MNTQEAYSQKFEAHLKEADAALDKLAAQAENAQADAKLGFKEQVKALRAKRDEFGREVSKINKANAAAIKDIQSGVERAWNELSESLKSAQAKFH